MLTFSCGRAFSASRAAVSIGAAVTLTVMAGFMSPASAQGEDIFIGGCVGTWHAVNCASRWAPPTDPFIRIVPQPVGDAERGRAIERDRKWLARCRPVVAQDHYGVARYQYAAPGCEFGVGEF